MTAIFRFVQCDDKSGAKASEAFWDCLRVNDSTRKGLLNAFLIQSEELGLNLPNCRGQYYDNRASIKGKGTGLQAKFLQIYC